MSQKREAVMRGNAARIEAGKIAPPISDGLGDAFMASTPSDVRRATGSTYTPLRVVTDMVSEAARHIEPACVVDCGCGSGRFSLAAAMMFPKARIYAVDISPQACSMCLENVRAHGLEGRVEVVNSSFMDFGLPSGRGKTLWIGNPPYVRHHQLDPEDKKRFKSTASRLGLPSSCLAGLHIHFLAHIAQEWVEGDFGMLVTSAEWLDVNYGNFARSLLTQRLPLVHMRLFDRELRLFEGTDSTAVVFSFSDSSNHSATVSLPNALDVRVPIESLRLSQKWSRTISCISSGKTDVIGDLVPLGSIASVHRGVVTGDNKFWVRTPQAAEELPAELSTPIVSHAREIMDGCVVQRDSSSLGRLVTLPAFLDVLSGSTLAAAQRIIDEGVRRGVDRGYVARSRRPWWAVRPPKPPAVMMTYMARRSPTFIRNDLGLPMLNVVHGIYPKQHLSEHALSNLVDYLNRNVSLQDGRVYCGGLAKFEPKEAEALLVPNINVLEA